MDAERKREILDLMRQYPASPAGLQALLQNDTFRQEFPHARMDAAWNYLHGRMREMTPRDERD